MGEGDIDPTTVDHLLSDSPCRHHHDILTRYLNGLGIILQAVLEFLDDLGMDTKTIFSCSVDQSVRDLRVSEACIGCIALELGAWQIPVT